MGLLIKKPYNGDRKNTNSTFHMYLAYILFFSVHSPLSDFFALSWNKLTWILSILKYSYSKTVN